ncbi:DNA repair and recombination protein RadB [Candidatus Pacearchaeota archaeon]|nr:DNA repair and recombination protein RadB [Candidatus Pacearchaeota archaeon]
MEVNRVSSGSFDVNDFLVGGYEKDVITMIAGGPGSGKTNLSILAACSQAKDGKKVIFIDSEGGFSIERVKQIVGEKYVEILENILILSPVNFLEQRHCFSRLASELKNGHVSLVIVDSVALLYRLELGDAVQSGEEGGISEVNREVAKQMQMLSEIARKERIPVIITNQVYKKFLSDEERDSGKVAGTSIVGGDLFRYWCKCIIEVSADSGRRKLKLLKHRSLGEKEMDFVIKDEGIFKRGFF